MILKIINWILALLGFSPRRPEEMPAEVPMVGEPVWLKAARAELGAREIPGDEHNPTVLGYFRDAGFPGIRDDETAWCAGFANAILERCGYGGSKSLAARSFLNWGKPVSKPYPGCIAVFSRGDPNGWQGHVGFYVGEENGEILVLGGNQSNCVNIAGQSKARLLGFREPHKPSNSRTYKAATANMVLSGISGAVLLDSQTQIMGISQIIKEMGVSVPGFQIASYLICIGLLCVIVWARHDDATSKGR